MTSPRHPSGAAAPITIWRKWRDRLLLQEDLNFLLTNRLPRIAATRLMGRLSKIRHPAWTRLAIGTWRLFTELDLAEARQSRFNSLHECFTRELKPGARPIDPDPDVLVSPCDGIVGATGTVQQGQVLQAKGLPYSLSELLGNDTAALPFINGHYVTLRLTSSMYHRLHAPEDAFIDEVHHLDGDTWNVNPIALARVQRLFCRNERAAIHMHLRNQGTPITLVAVAAILVSGIRLHAVPGLMRAGERGPQHFRPRCAVQRGQELGWFEHGSTIILFAPPGWTLEPRWQQGDLVRMGQALLRRNPAG